jgi:hydroxymethylglutaryl-CoA lyase
MKIVEVGPRDGLQNETAPVPTETKVAFVDALSATGVNEIEVSAFVSPGRVPQLGDAENVFRNISRRSAVVYSALVPNERGLDRAIEARVDKVSVFTAASETFNRKNINTSIKGSIQRFLPVVKRAQRLLLPTRGYVSTAFWCAFEGKMQPEAVIAVVERLMDIGINEVSISDTIGKASPDEVKRLLDLLLLRIPAERIAMHFHDTYGKGVENVLASRSHGISIFDASVGSMGGCPFAPGATGNVATEAVVKALEDQGEKLLIDLQKLSEARRLLDPFLVEDRRSLPKDGSPACAACQFSTGEVCCQRNKSNGQNQSG